MIIDIYQDQPIYFVQLASVMGCAGVYRRFQMRAAVEQEVDFLAEQGEELLVLALVAKSYAVLV